MLGKEALGYHVDEKIGSGGFGTVYKVSKINASGTYVRALKHITLPTKKQYTEILNSMGGDYSKADDYFATILKDIVSEIRILSLLSESGNQNIVKYYENDIVETPSPKKYDIFILMEYLTAFPDYLESTSLKVKDVIKLGKDILNALISCHSKNIIHRDIKDDNIFVSVDGTFKLGDFGVSKALKDQSRAASIKGTPNFIAPEVYLGKENYDHTVDLYSLGIVMYRLLNRSRNPFLPEFPDVYDSKDEETAFEERMLGKTPKLPLLAQNELGKTVLKAIMPREERYDSAKEFMNALESAERSLSEGDLGITIGLPMPTFSETKRSLNDNFDSSSNITMGIGVTMGMGTYDFNNQFQTNEDDKHLFDTITTPVTLKAEEKTGDQEKIKPTKKKRILPLCIGLAVIITIVASIFIYNFLDDIEGNTISVGSTTKEPPETNKDITNNIVENTTSADSTPQDPSETNQDITDIGVGNNAIMFKTLEVNGTEVYGNVSNDTTMFSFLDEIAVTGNAVYTVSKNAAGTDTVPYKTVELAVGDNTFYLFETLGDDITLYVVTIRRKPMYEVIIQLSENETIRQMVEEDSFVEQPSPPLKTGHTFIGWDYDFDNAITQNTVIFAKWTVNQYNITLQAEQPGAGTISGAGNYDYGKNTTITATTNPGYTFVGWYNDTEKVSADMSHTFMVVEERMLTAKWEIDADMTAFDFTSTSTSCTITRIKNKAVDTVKIPDYVTAIECGVFAECNSLESITLPFVGATKAGTLDTHFGYIFGAPIGGDNNEYVPSSLKNVIITGGLSIDQAAFAGCKSLTNIIVSDSVVSIGCGAFFGCDNLNSITLPFVGADFVHEGTAMYLTNFGSIFGALKYEWNYGYVPSSLTEVVVTGGSQIDAYSFYGCVNITDIILPTGIVQIGDSAFEDCENLTNINIPTGVTSIGKSAFENCESLITVIIPDGVTYIGDFAFQRCFRLSNVSIPNSVTHIDDRVFFCCYELEGYAYDGVVYIGNDSNRFLYLHDVANKNCSSVTIPSSTKFIGSYAFENCTNLSNLIIPNNITYICASAFCNSTGLLSITIPDSVEYIGSDAFYGCKALSQVSFFNELKAISDGMFRGCTNLSSMVIPNSVKNIGSAAFYDCENLTNITLPNNVTAIGSAAFYNCTNLIEVTFKNILGWSAGTTVLSSSELANSSTAASYLTDTYSSYAWEKS